VRTCVFAHSKKGGMGRPGWGGMGHPGGGPGNLSQQMHGRHAGEQVDRWADAGAPPYPTPYMPARKDIKSNTNQTQTPPGQQARKDAQAELLQHTGLPGTGGISAVGSCLDFGASLTSGAATPPNVIGGFDSTVHASEVS